jgi:hypothetical protein
VIRFCKFYVLEKIHDLFELRIIMNSACEQLADLLKIQEVIIRRHIDVHKWLRHIPDQEQGMIDFIETYGWLLREMYCGHVCSKRIGCSIAAEYIPPAE